MFNQNAPIVVTLVLILILTSAFLISYLMVPKITLNKDSISIKNMFVNFNILINEIEKIEKIETTAYGNIRNFGVGGIFGYFGFFNGNDVWYVTNIYKKVKVVMDNGKVYMISPETPVAFVEEIKKRKEAQ